MGEMLAPTLLLAEPPDALLHGVALRHREYVYAILKVCLDPIALRNAVSGIIHLYVQLVEELVHVEAREVPTRRVGDPVLGSQGDDGNLRQPARGGQHLAHHISIGRQRVPDVVHAMRKRTVLPPLAGLDGLVDEACWQQRVVPIENHDGHPHLLVHGGAGVEGGLAAVPSERGQRRRTRLQSPVAPGPPGLQALLMLRERLSGHAAHSFQDLHALRRRGDRVQVGLPLLRAVGQEPVVRCLVLVLKEPQPGGEGAPHGQLRAHAPHPRHLAGALPRKRSLSRALVGDLVEADVLHAAGVPHPAQDIAIEQGLVKLRFQLALFLRAFAVLRRICPRKAALW
mmetsp:Transcript_77885/g.225248  ORF Transcript_77885/g.225248 Transcript_77885/m.225248 type:complete len:341 (-) Transcript_77885:203-1225(-)